MAAEGEIEVGDWEEWTEVVAGGEDPRRPGYSTEMELGSLKRWGRKVGRTRWA